MNIRDRAHFVEEIEKRGCIRILKETHAYSLQYKDGETIQCLTVIAGGSTATISNTGFLRGEFRYIPFHLITTEILDELIGKPLVKADAVPPTYEGIR